MQVPIVNIHGGISGDRYRFIFRFRSGPDIEADSLSSESEISAYRGRFFQRLHGAARAMITASDPECDLDQLKAFVKDVHGAGRTLMVKALGQKHFGAIARRMAEAFAPFSKTDPTRTLAPIVEVTAPGLFFPAELMPLLGEDLPENFDSLRKVDVFNVMRSFVGMSAIVRRIGETSHGLHQGLNFSARPLPIKLFAFSDLGGADNELAFFRKQGNGIALDGPWPVGADDERPGVVTRLRDSIFGPQKQDARETEKAHREFARDMAGHLMNPHKTFSGAERLPPSQIHHFSCHCDPHQGDQILRLKGRGRNVDTISIEEIEEYLPSAALNHPRPLVFLNACGTDKSNDVDFSSFKTLFLRTDHRGLIATQSVVPDKFAAQFSESFYGALLQSDSVGQALQVAKWTTLYVFQNPMGLMYSFYGNPDLKIEPLEERQPAASA